MNYQQRFQASNLIPSLTNHREEIDQRAERDQYDRPENGIERSRRAGGGGCGFKTIGLSFDPLADLGDLAFHQIESIRGRYNILSTIILDYQCDASLRLIFGLVSSRSIVVYQHKNCEKIIYRWVAALVTRPDL